MKLTARNTIRRKAWKGAEKLDKSFLSRHPDARISSSPRGLGDGTGMQEGKALQAGTFVDIKERYGESKKIFGRIFI